jgi:hypothetical protein
MPDRVPTSWQMHCAFIEPSERPLSPAHVSLSYRSVDGHESIWISQRATAMVNDDGWQEVIRDGISVKVTEPASTILAGER